MAPRERILRTDVESLVAESGWVRRLALAVARDSQAADEVAQEAWVAVLARPPAERGDLKGWLARVVRNLARFRARSDARRSSREQAAARPEALEDPALAFERLDLQEALLREVRSLAEPYRTAIVLRFFEGLEPKEIAARVHAPLRTVHTRITRGLGELRERLDQRTRGGRSAWLSAWMPLLAPKTPFGAWIAAMDLKLKLALVAAVAAAGLYVAWPTSQGAGPVLASGVTGDGSPILESASPFSDGGELRSTVAETPPRTTPREALAAVMDPAPSRTITGIVVTLDGSPVPGIGIGPASRRASSWGSTSVPFSRRVLTSSGMSSTSRGHVAVSFAEEAPAPEALRASSPLATSDLAGRFEIAQADHGSALRATNPDWTTVYEPHLREPDPPEGYVLVVARRQPLRGRVVDAAGDGLPGATVRCGFLGSATRPRSVGFFDEGRSSLPIPLDDSVVCDWNAASGPDGVFEIEDAPDVAGLGAWASQGTLQSPVFQVGDRTEAIVLVLGRQEEAPGLVHGRVVDPDGNAVAGSRVLFGPTVVLTDDLGSFTLDVAAHPEGSRVVALHEAWRPASVLCLAGSADAPGAWPEPLEIVFTLPAPAIPGRVVDAAGRPIEGAGVRLLDPIETDEVFAAAGALRSIPQAENDVALPLHERTTDAEGRFEFRCPLQRVYRLRAEVRGRLAIATAEAIPGTGEVTIVIPDDPNARPLGGRIVDPRGNPVAGASVRARRTFPASGHDAPRVLETDAVATDADGHFEIPGVGPDVDGVSIQPESSAPGSVRAIDPGLDRRKLVFVVGLLGRVQIAIEQPGLEADQVSVLDRDGRRLAIGARRGDGAWICSTALPLVGGRSEPLLVSEEGVVAVVTVDGREIARREIRITPGKLTPVRF